MHFYDAAFLKFEIDLLENLDFNGAAMCSPIFY